MPITSLRFTNAGPFDDITFEFDRQVNVFTGPNNSGKSTVLLVLAETAVFPITFPRKILKGDESKWEMTLADVRHETPFEGVLPIDLNQQDGAIEPLRHLGYTTFVPALRRITDFRSKGPSIQIERRLASRASQNDAVGKAIRKIRSLPNVRADDFDDDSELQELQSFVASRARMDDDPELEKRRNLIATNATTVSDAAVIRRIVQLDYRAYRRGQPQIRRLIETVADVASEITEGFPLEFNGVNEDERGYFPEFRTPDGILPLNVLSQGTQSIIQWLAQFLFGYAQYYDYPENLAEKPGILLVDEIDAHLHPSWQRRIIPALTGHFPNLQIFCSTHSPLMLAGLKAGQVQLLRRDASGQVTVSRNETDIIGWSAEEILRSVLGVRDTTDLTTASEIDRMGELIVKETLTEEERNELKELRQRVGEALPGGPASSQMESFARFLNEVYAKPEPNLSSADRKRPRVSRRNAGAE